MKKSLFLSLILGIVVFGRENPFFALDPSKSKVSSNIIEHKEPLQNINTKFSPEDRVLKEITLTVQKLDGSVESKTYTIDKSIDWHQPLTISQSGLVKAKANSSASVNSADFGFAKFTTQNRVLTVETSDTLSRFFTLSDPSRIVLDFDRAASIQTTEKIMNSGIFKSIQISNHNKFIRATIVLDGIYRSEMKKVGNTIKIECK